MPNTGTTERSETEQSRTEPPENEKRETKQSGTELSETEKTQIDQSSIEPTETEQDENVRNLKTAQTDCNSSYLCHMYICLLAARKQDYMRFVAYDCLLLFNFVDETAVYFLFTTLVTHFFSDLACIYDLCFRV